GEPDHAQRREREQARNARGAALRVHIAREQLVGTSERDTAKREKDQRSRDEQGPLERSEEGTLQHDRCTERERDDRADDLSEHTLARPAAQPAVGRELMEAFEAADRLAMPKSRE